MKGYRLSLYPFSVGELKLGAASLGLSDDYPPDETNQSLLSQLNQINDRLNLSLVRHSMWDYSFPNLVVFVSIVGICIQNVAIIASVLLRRR